MACVNDLYMISSGEPIIAYCSWGDGRLDIFKRGKDNLIGHKSIENAVHSDWEMIIKDEIDSCPSAVSWGPNRMDVVVKAKNGSILHTWWDGKWNEWENIGGEATSPPCITSWGENHLDVFIRGKDGAIFQKTFNERWENDWQTLQGDWASGPGAGSWGKNRIDVFARGKDNALWHQFFDGQWHSWESFGGFITSAPSVACSLVAEKNRIDVFCVGKYGAIWHKWYDGVWRTLKYFGGENACTPACVAIGKTVIYLCYLTKEGEASLRTWNGNNWSDWKHPNKTSITGHKTERNLRPVIKKEDLIAWILTQKSVLFNLTDFRNMLISGKAFQEEVYKRADNYILYLLRLIIAKGEKGPRNWFKKYFHDEVKDYVKSARVTIINRMLKETQNHIVNSTCANGFDSWNITQGGPDGWAVEECEHKLPCPRKKQQKIFCGNKELCEMEQTVFASSVPTLKDNYFQCAVEAGAYISCRPDCPSFSKVILRAFDEDGKVIKESNVVNDNFQLPQDRPNCFKYVVLRIDDTEILTKAAKFTLVLQSKDCKNWAGHYGSRYTDIFFRVIPLSYFDKVEKKKPEENEVKEVVEAKEVVEVKEEVKEEVIVKEEVKEEVIS